MILIENINQLKTSDLICIYHEDEMFNGYILEIVESEPGTLILIMSHDSEFYEEDLIDIAYDDNTGEILIPEIYLLDR